MTLEEIIKKITEFLKGIYRSEKFAEGLISFVTGFLLTKISMAVLLNSRIGDRIFWEDENFLFYMFLALYYFVSRTLYRFIIKKFRS